MIRRIAYPLIWFSAVAAVLAPQAAFGLESRAFFMSGAGVYQNGKTFKTQLAVNSGGGKGVNAAESILKYDPNFFTLKTIATSSTIFELWIKKPQADKDGRIKFSGGMPRPFTGSAGNILTLELTPKRYGKTYITMSSSSILSADGTGKDVLTEAWNGVFTIGTSRDVANANKFINGLSGRILLQVERNGEAWYVYPSDKKRYFLGRPQDAFDIMRKLGLGAAHKYIAAYQGRTYPSAVWGKILLDVELNGEAYYVSPVDKKGYYLGRPADAFRIMREKGLGITNNDLDKIPNWAVNIIY